MRVTLVLKFVSYQGLAQILGLWAFLLLLAASLVLAEPNQQGPRKDCAEMLLRVQNGKREFFAQEVKNPFASSDLGSLSSADLDGDSRADLVATSQKGELLVSISNSKYSFQNAVVKVLTPECNAMRWIGSNCSGGIEEELVGYRPDSSNLCVLQGVMTASFSTSSRNLQQVIPGSGKVELAELTGDSFLDLAFVSSSYLNAFSGGPNCEFKTDSTIALQPIGQLVGAGDFTGEQKLGVMGYRAYFRDLVVSTGVDGSFGVASPSWSIDRNWAEVAQESPPLFGVIGDFNGDALDDYFAYVGSVGGWYLVLSTDRGYGLENAVAVGVVGDREPFLVVADDFDGDGLDEVLLLGRTSKKLILLESGLVKPLGNARVKAGSSTGVTDANGRICLGSDSAIADEVVLEDEDLELTRSYKVPTTVNQRGVSTLLAVPSRKSDGLYGQSVRFGPDDVGPYLCNGFHPGTVKNWGRTSGDCPEGYAVFALGEVAGKVASNANALTNAVCCRLPSTDILAEERVFAEEECPHNYFAVGLRNSNSNESVHVLNCAKINTRRYELGVTVPGRYRGYGMNMRRYGGAAYDEFLPLGFRFGAKRASSRGFEMDGCVGNPPGSLAVRKGKRCGDQGFRQLTYRGVSGDPERGSPVVMFPTCEEISNVFDPTAGCIEK